MLSLVIPTYRERENLEPLLTRLKAVRAVLSEPIEVLIVDDQSPDGTAQHAQRLLSQSGLGRVVEHHGKRDLGLAVREGVRHARGDLIGFMDADLSHPPELLPTLVAAVRSGNEVAIASRYVKGGGIANWPWSRRVLSRLANRLTEPLVHVADATSGYFVCRASVLNASEWHPKGYKVLLELLARGCLHETQEVPYYFRDRQRGVSKLGMRTLALYSRQLVALYYDRRCYPYRHRRGSGTSSDSSPAGGLPAEKIVDAHA